MSDTTPESNPENLELSESPVPQSEYNPNHEKNIKLTWKLTTLLQFASFMSPLFISFFMIMVSIINNKVIKGLIYLFGLTLITSLNYLLKILINKTVSKNASAMCSILPDPFTKINDKKNPLESPNYSATAISYTATYLIFPMVINNKINPALLTIMLSLLVINCSVEYFNNCADVSSLILGISLGVSFAMIYYGIIASSSKENEKLLFFTENLGNNAQQCELKNQQYRCNVYRNGHLIG